MAVVGSNAAALTSGSYRFVSQAAPRLFQCASQTMEWNRWMAFRFGSAFGRAIHGMVVGCCTLIGMYHFLFHPDAQEKEVEAVCGYYFLKERQ